MDNIELPVSQARRRLVIGQYLAMFPWCLTATLSIALVALALPKFWVMNVDANIWLWSWLGGAFVTAILVAGVITYFTRRTKMEAAIELDRRCGLKERVSTMLSLDSEMLASPTGQALLKDAERRVANVDVNEEFKVSLPKRGWTPILPALAVLFVALMFADRMPDPAVAGQNAPTGGEVKKSTEVLKRRLAEHRKKAEQQGLKDAEGLFDKLEQQSRQLEKAEENDQRKALVKLNDLSQQLQQRREKLGDPAELQKQFEKLNQLPKGPADKVADAIKKGNLNEAQRELNKLQEKLKDGALDEKEQADLSNQMKEMQSKLEQAAQAQKEAAQELKEKISQAQAAGDVDKADKLQQALDKMAQQGPQSDAMKNLAEQLGQAADQMKQGNAEQAAQALDKVSQNLEQMKEQLEEMEMLDQALDQIADAKESMRGGKPGEEGEGNQPGGQEGQGNQPGQPGQQGGDKQDGGGDGGLEAGQGRQQKGNVGNAIDPKMYDSQIKGKPEPGTGVVVDMVEGPNIKGQTRESIKMELQEAVGSDADPLTGEKLPRQVRDHVKEYFDAFREGK